MARNQRKVGQDKDAIVAQLPLACTEEAAATEFMERQRWGSEPFCARCGCTSVYKMVDAKTGQRNRRFLWRCHDCKKQFTVRIGTVLEESRIPLKHWAYAFWRASTSKKGVSALEIKRQTGLSYKSALFMMHRIRFAMTERHQEKLTGIVEADETYVGGKPRIKGPHNKRGFGTKKTPVSVVVERGGNARARVMTQRITSRNLRSSLKELVDESRSTLMTDELPAYRQAGRMFAGGHHAVEHSAKEYARGDAHVNTAESFFAIVKRGLNGIYHSVSKEHLHRYIGEFEFRFNGRKMTDGERTVAAIRGAEGKRLYYKVPAA